MANVKVTVWHDAVTGQIIAIGRPQGEGNYIPVAAENQAILETDIDDAEIAALPERFLVDPARRIVVSREEFNASNS